MSFRIVYLECKEGNSDKFYKIIQRNLKVSLRYGRCGADGVTSEKSFSSLAEANTFVDKTAIEKRKKGYHDSADSADAVDEVAPKAEAHVKKAGASKRKISEVEPAPAVNLKSSGPSSITNFYLTCTTGGSNKFYEAIQNGCKVSFRYGKTGSAGATSFKVFSTAAEAQTNLQQVLNEKLKKGYKHNDPEGAQKAQKHADNDADIEDDNEDDKGDIAGDENDESDFDDHSYVSETENNDNNNNNGIDAVDDLNGDILIDSDAADEDYVESEGDDEEKNPVSKKRAVKVSTASASMSVAVGTGAGKKQKVTASGAVSVVSTSSTSSSSTAPAPPADGISKTFCLTCTEGNSDKFYELIQTNLNVKLRYGRSGADGVSSVKEFKTLAEANKFMEKTKNDKLNKGYKLSKTGGPPSGVAGGSNNAQQQAESSGDLSQDLENGLKVFVKGSSAMPYTLKKFNGGYSCTCQGWTMQIRIKGVQGASCKHLKLVRGEEEEARRCGENAGVNNPSGKKNTSIPAKISLAQAWKTTMDPTGYLMSEKLDGMRAYWNGKGLFSRAGNPVITPDWFTENLPADMHLDGELFLGRGMFSECMTITRRSDAKGDWNRVCYVVFDAPNIKGGILSRLEAAMAVLDLNPSPYARVHPHEVCNGTEHLLEELSKIEKIAGEGLMLRNPHAAHRGGRSSDLLKVKSFQDDEALVIDYEAGKGKYTGQIGSLVCILRNGNQFKVGSGLTDVQRTKGQAPKKGTVITVKFFELTEDGVPRFPTFLRVRPDVDASEFPVQY